MQSADTHDTIASPRRESPARMEVVPLHPSRIEAKTHELAMERPVPIVKLCASCRYSFFDGWGMKCNQPSLKPMDLATGERQYADIERRLGTCGEHGALFEPKPPRIPWYIRLLWRISKWLERT